MTQTKKHKICLVGECLAGGGAERVQATLSDYLVKQNITVHHVIFISLINFPFSGRLLNLGEIESKISIVRKIKCFFALKRYLKNHRFDIVIDFRVKHNFLQEFAIDKFLYPKQTYYTVHSSNLDYYFPSQKWIAKLLYSRGKRVIAVSEGIARKITEHLGWKNIKTIHNPIDSKVLDTYSSGLQNKHTDFVLAVGRMDDEVKQFDKLIDTYAKSDLPEKNIRLVILGGGKYKKKLMQHAVDKKLTEYVFFEDFQINPFIYMKQARFLILCSKFEGFGNVLIESLACGSPVVSFDCDFGPAEIIKNKQNGLLVENQNFDALKLAINEMVLNQELYTTCKQNAVKSVAEFSIETIGKQWMDVLKINRD